MAIKGEFSVEKREAATELLKVWFVELEAIGARIPESLMYYGMCLDLQCALTRAQAQLEALQSAPKPEGESERVRNAAISLINEVRGLTGDAWEYAQRHLWGNTNYVCLRYKAVELGLAWDDTSALSLSPKPQAVNRELYEALTKTYGFLLEDGWDGPWVQEVSAVLANAKAAIEGEAK